eukprot:SAG22_NODE_666_length_8013_cov_2.524640_7_plen_1400_part_00
MEVGADNPVAFAVHPGDSMVAHVQLLGVETPGAGDYNATLRIRTNDPNNPYTEVALRFHVDHFTLVIVGLPKTLDATVAPGEVADRTVTVYNVYSAGLTFGHDGCTCDSSPVPNTGLPCRLNSTAPLVAIGACNHSLSLGGDAHVPVRLVAPTAAGLYELEWRMRPTSPSGLPQFWDVTAVVMVVADPAMFELERTTLAVTTSVIATEPFDILATVRDTYGNVITASGVRVFSLRLIPTSDAESSGTIETFGCTYDVVAGYLVRDVIVQQNGTHEANELLTDLASDNSTASLREPFTIEAGALLCAPPQTYPSQNGNQCLRAYCERGSEVTEDLLGCQRCEYGEFSDDGHGHGRQCQSCEGGTMCDALGCVACLPCGPGEQPSAGHVSCESCPDGTAGVGGVCTQCADGSEPDASSITCAECAAGRTGSGGVCDTDCVPGSQPNVDKTGCTSCLAGLYSPIGEECLECLLVVSEDQTGCNPAYSCPLGFECLHNPCFSDADCTQRGPGNISIGTTRCMACSDQGKVANLLQSQCVQCSPGAEPASNRTQCLRCVGNSFSKFGIECESCSSGTATNADRTQCDQIEQGAAITDPAVLEEILNGTEFLRPIATLEFEVSDGVLVNGSDAQSLFFEQAAADLTATLAVGPGDITVIGIQQTRRRLLQLRRAQSSSAAQLEFEIVPAMAGTVMAELDAQLADPTSPLRTSAGPLASINPDVAPVFNVACPAGRYLPDGATDCEKCPAGEYLNTDANPPSCKACVAALGEEPSDLGDSCVCMDGFYNTVTRTAITCHRGDYFPPPAALPFCTACSELDCVTECSGGGHVVVIEQGWSATVQSDGTVAVLECVTDSSSGGCPGGETNATVIGTACTYGYNGLLCSSCDPDYTWGSDGLCTKCEEWSATGGVLIVVLAILTLFALMNVHAWYGSLTTVQAMVESIKEMEVAAIGKMLATVQIITALPNVLGIQLPGIFRTFLNMLSVFKFDLMLSPGVGCLTHGKYLPSLVGTVVSVVVVLLAVLVMYMRETSHADSAVDVSRDDHTEILKQIYRKFDTDGDGIGEAELVKIVKDLDPGASASTTAAMFKQVDTDSTGRIDFAEFQEAVDSNVDNEESDDSNAVSNGLRGLAVQAQKADVQGVAIGRIFLFVFLIYPTVTNKIFAGFYCREVGPGASILMADNDVQCTNVDGSFTAEYTGLFTFCCVLVIVWPIGMPVLLFMKLFAVRTKIQEQDEDTLNLFGAVVGDYDGNHWYWELVELARKLCLTGLIGLLGRGSVAQTIAASFVAAMFSFAHCWAQPFVASNLNMVKACSEFIILAVLVVCIVQQTYAAADDFNAEETITMDDYGAIQTGMCMMLLPTTVFFVGKQLQDLRSELVATDGEGGETEVDANEMENPVHGDTAFD